MEELKSHSEAHWNTRTRRKFNAVVDIVSDLVQDSEAVIATPFYPFAELLTEENTDILPEEEETRYDTRLLEGLALGRLYVTNARAG